MPLKRAERPSGYETAPLTPDRIDTALLQPTHHSAHGAVAPSLRASAVPTPILPVPPAPTGAAAMAPMTPGI